MENGSALPEKIGVRAVGTDVEHTPSGSITGKPAVARSGSSSGRNSSSPGAAS